MATEMNEPFLHEDAMQEVKAQIKSVRTYLTGLAFACLVSVIVAVVAVILATVIHHDSSSDTNATPLTPPANCGIGTYQCVGEQYNPAFASAQPYPGFNNITGDEVDVVEALDVPGWWKTTIYAGYDKTTKKYGFNEVEYCTKDAGAVDRLTMSPGTNLICITGKRTDMVDPAVAISYTQTSCDSFTKVITAGPATGTDGSMKAPSISRVTCSRASTSTKTPPQEVHLGNANGYTRQDLGRSKLTRTYGKFADLPLTPKNAIKAGWAAVNDGKCDPNLGITYGKGDPSPSSPVQLMYTAAGQLAGVTVYVYGKVWPSLVTKGFWIPAGTHASPIYGAVEVHKIMVSFRSKTVMCNSNSFSKFDMGDRLVVNQGSPSSGSMEIPLTFREAIQNGWDKYGSCFTGMGIHSSYSLDAEDRKKNWFAGTSGDNLMPVVAMYDAVAVNGKMEPSNIVSIFFTAPDQSFTRDGVKYNYDNTTDVYFDGPQGNTNMCQNWCAGSGTFTPSLTMTPSKGFCNYQSLSGATMGPTSSYDTFHFQFVENTDIQCPVTTDMICGGKNDASCPVAPENQCVPTSKKGYNTGPPGHCSFQLASKQMAAAQCCYSSMAAGLVKAHVPTS